MQNDRTFRFGRSSETPLGHPAIDEVSDGAHHARQSDYFLSIFFFFDFFLLAMAAILVRVETPAVGEALAPDRENSIARNVAARK
jgi:hypothetical protein